MPAVPFKPRRKPPPAPHGQRRLYGLKGCLATRWLALLMREKQLEPPRLFEVNPLQPPEELHLLNPGLKLPLLVERDLAIATAPVIAAYLEERHPHPPLLPGDPADRARVRLLLDEVFTRGLLAPSPESRRALLLDLAGLLGTRGGLLGLPYHLADAAAAVLLAEAGPSLAQLPERAAERLSAYRERLNSRPAVQSGA